MAGPDYYGPPYDVLHYVAAVHDVAAAASTTTAVMKAHRPCTWPIHIQGAPSRDRHAFNKTSDMPSPALARAAGFIPPATPDWRNTRHAGQTDRQAGRQTDRHRQTQRQTQTQTQTQTDRHRQTQTDADRHRHRHRHIYTYTYTYTYTHRHRQTETDR